MDKQDKSGFLARKDEWFERFAKSKTESGSLAAKIATTDAKIDNLVYEIYGLTEEDIKVVEDLGAFPT